MVESGLGCKLGVNSVFVSADGMRALTLDEIAAQVAELVAGKGVTA